MASDYKLVEILLHKLCRKITTYNEDEVLPVYKSALATIGGRIVSSLPEEFAVSEKIKKKLAQQKTLRDAALFSEWHSKLQSRSCMKQRGSLLHLLHLLSRDKHSGSTGRHKAFSLGLAGHAMSTPFVPHRHVSDHTSASGHHHGASHSGMRSMPRVGDNNTVMTANSSGGTSGIASSISTIHSSNTNSTRTQYTPMDSAQDDRLRDAYFQSHSNAGSRMHVKRKKKRAAKDEVSQLSLMKDVVYALQGIESRFIHIDLNRDCFTIDNTINVNQSQRRAVHKLAECGWLYTKIRQYINTHIADRAFGLVGQSFCAALQRELTEYASLIAVLESQLQMEEDGGIDITDSVSLSLHSLSVWMYDPLIRLKAIAALVDACEGKKGGALTSAIHSYLQHGNPVIQSLVKNILTQVTAPIFTIILRWIYDGELEDLYQEFFVASDPTVKDDELWLHKYSLRKFMLPSFITAEQAKKILLTGKSINFLRQLCQDRTIIRKRDAILKAETHKVESIFNQDLDNAFTHMIDTVYTHTSQHLMDVLYKKYKFMDHLKAMRRYLLLGQGDFIRHLMDLLEEDLAKPATSLFLHNLTGILEAAIRATNAQFDDADILKRVDVRLLEVSPGDTGWDVFSLDYHVDGATRTVFTPECMIMYLRVFNFLWRAKRMEYILANIWRGQMANGRVIKHLEGISPLLYQSHVIGSEMVHFVQQVQYYINFEVLECTWDELLQQVIAATDLDQILSAHHHFLSTIISRCLLDDHSCGILTQLRAIFDLIINFQTIQDTLYHSACEEVHARENYQQLIDENTQQGEWGTNEELEQQELQRRHQFTNSLLPSIRSKLQVLTHSYQDLVQQFLMMLTKHTDINLRFLSFRLDFNEHYNCKQPKVASVASNSAVGPTVS